MPQSFHAVTGETGNGASGDTTTTSSSPGAAPSATETVAPGAKPSVEEQLASLSKQYADLHGSHTGLKEDFIKLRRKRGDGDEAPPAKPGEPSPKAPGARDEVLASWKLADAMSALPESGRAKVRAKVEAGASFDDAIAYADALKEGMGFGATPNPSKGATPVPPGRAATAPTEQSAQRFENREQWEKWKGENRDRAIRYMADNPDFDPTVLPITRKRPRL